MVILILLLWSLCAVYITRFLYQRNMKVAAAMYAVLYVYLTVWIFLVTSLDVFHFGLDADATADLYAGDLYRSFAGLMQLFDQFSAEALLGIVFGCVALAISMIAFVVIGGVQLVRAIAKVLKGKALRKAVRKVRDVVRVHGTYAPTRIYLQYCRLNN